MRAVAMSVITSLMRAAAFSLSSVICLMERLRSALCCGKLNRQRTITRRIIKRSLATVLESDDHIVIAFPMPRGVFNFARIRASSTSVVVEASGSVILLHQFARRQHSTALMISVTVRHTRRLPIEVDASHGYATMDERRRMLFVHLPKVTACRMA